MARNPMSKIPSARNWHWVDYKTLLQGGVKWKPKNENATGRHVGNRGYWVLTRRGMTEEDIKLATEHEIWMGTKSAYVFEHRLVALKKFGSLPPGMVVRHLNGIKTDNSPENLLLGTSQENTMDHNTARLMTMYWRNKYEELLKSIDSR